MAWQPHITAVLTLRTILVLRSGRYPKIYLESLAGETLVFTPSASIVIFKTDWTPDPQPMVSAYRTGPSIPSTN